MFIGADDLNPGLYDAVVVGSGPAGATVALKLSARGKRVLIVETGGREFDPDLQARFAALSGRGHYDGDYWARHWIRAFGGTSWAWNGWCAPLLERNLADWPITRDDLDPYYRQAADILGLPYGFLNYEAPYSEGFDYRPFQDEPPMRFGDPALGLFAEDPNVHVLTLATVTGLVARDDRTALTGLRLWRPGADARDIALREGQAVVIAAGGMGNAQILLASRPGDGAAIGNETDQVGRYLMEHPHFYDCARLVVPGGEHLPPVPEGFGSHVPVIVPDAEMFAGLGGLDVSVELDETAPNTDDPMEVFLLDRMGEGAKSYQLTVRSEMRPDPANRVELDIGHDPSGLPRLRSWCVIGTEALRTADRCLQILGTRMAATGRGRLRIINDRLYRDIYGGGHTMGTTRMGSDPRTSVVDRDCRVHGYRNLYVAGSSVFRTGGYANPTLTIAALAARLADHLAGAR